MMNSQGQYIAIKSKPPPPLAAHVDTAGSSGMYVKSRNIQTLKCTKIS